LLLKSDQSAHGLLLTNLLNYLNYNRSLESLIHGMRGHLSSPKGKKQALTQRGEKRIGKVSMKHPKFILLMSLLLASVFLNQAFSAERVMLARIHLAEKAQIREIQSLHLDIAYAEYGQYIDIVTDQEEVEYLRSLGYEVEIVHQDLVAFYQSRLDRTKDMGGYHTYSEINAELDSMHTLYASLTSSRIDIGHSLQDSVIWAFKISDNASMDEDEPEVFYNSLIHAREPAGMEVLLYFMWYLLENYGTDSLTTYLVDNRELWFVLVVNPDGYCYNEYTNPNGGGMWRKNRRDCGGGNWGVDLNRNFGYMWGYDDEGSSPYCWDETYRGSGPFSEPATQVIRDFINARNFVMCLDNHTHGMWLLYPWSYDQFYTPHHNLYVAIAESMAVLNGHTPGTPWEVLYPVNGGSIDWEYGDTVSKPMIIAISPEIGTQDDGFWPPPDRILPLCQLELPANLLYAELADNPYQILPPASPVLIEMDTVETSYYVVNWSFQDTLNPAASFELVEMTGFERITYDVESGYSNWDLSGFSISTNRYHSSSHSFYSGQGDRLNNRVTAQNSIIVQAGDTLKVWCWYDIETNWDYAYVEISRDGGTIFFSIPGNITTDYNPYGNNLGNGITGSSGGWVEGIFDLSDYVGEQIYFRLHYVTDGYVYEEGFYADDIFPFETYQNTVVLSDAITDTFHQITGQIDGIYYYKVKAKDQQDQIGPWSNVEDLVVLQAFTCGDANGDGVINSADVTYLINYLFKSGSEPVPWEAGDTNSDGIINSSDIVYLINYLFRGGPPPGD